MENGGERRAMRRLATELGMCSTCSGIVFKFKRTAIPNSQEEVVEVVTEGKKMWDLMNAVLLHGPLQEMEPAGATKKHWQVLRRRRRIMMETKRCPTCSGSLLEACPTSSSEEGIEFMSQDGKGTKKIATEDEAMVADARSEHKLKRSREEGKRSSSGLKEKKKKKAKSEDKEDSGSKKKKAKRSNEMEGSGSRDAKMKGSGLQEEVTQMEGSGSREAKMKGSGLEEEVTMDRKTKMEITRMLKPSKPQSKEAAKMEDSELAVGNRKTKMVTKRMDKKSIDNLMKNQPHRDLLNGNLDFVNQAIIDMITANYEVDRVFLEYLQRRSFIKGYAEYQVEVTDDEGDDHKLV